MRCRGWLGVLLLAAWPQVAQAQAAADDGLDEAQKLGRRLFGNHCVVLHVKPQITSGQYGPVLSKIARRQPRVMRDVISNGTPHMPGFKTQFQPAQIDAIVAYLKTVPAPSAPRAPR